MGKGLLYQSGVTPGVKCVAVCRGDVDVRKCRGALTSINVPHQMVENAAQFDAAIASGLVAVCEDGTAIAAGASVDVVIEATSGVETAIGHCIAVLQKRKHLILMNSEVDLTFGPLLTRIARERGVICTSCGGDQYGVLKDCWTTFGFGVLIW